MSHLKKPLETPAAVTGSSSAPRRPERLLGFRRAQPKIDANDYSSQRLQHTVGKIACTHACGQSVVKFLVPETTRRFERFIAPSVLATDYNNRRARGLRMLP